MGHVPVPHNRNPFQTDKYTLEGATLISVNNRKVTGSFEITGQGELDFIIHGNLSNGYHKMTPTKGKFFKGVSEGRLRNEENERKLQNKKSKKEEISEVEILRS